MEKVSTKILSKLNESADYPDFEKNLMQQIKNILDNTEGVEATELYYNLEGSYCVKYKYDDETFVISSDMLLI